MNKVMMASAVVLALGVNYNIANAAEVSIVWKDNSSPDASYPGTNIIPGSNKKYTKPFAMGKEVRMLSPAVFGVIAVANGMKNAFNGGETWTFTDGTMTNVTGTGNTPGAGVSVNPLARNVVTAAPDGDIGAFQNAPFFNLPFGFLAPIQGSAAGDAYGAATINLADGADDFSIFFPVLEAQYGGFVFPLGQNGDMGVTFDCNGAMSGDINCYGEHTIAGSEDPSSAGFSRFTAQWELHGVLTMSQVPVPAAVWLFGSGLIGLVGLARKNKRA